MSVTDSAPSEPTKAPKSVFISYSRKDLAFVDRLAAALDAHGFVPTIDRTEIYAFEDWWRRIQSLILAADTVIFVLSPDAVGSEICRKEVAYAQSLNKRFAPIVCRRLDAELDKVPPALADLNFIFFDEPAAFDATLARLVEALETDIEWIRRHTIYGQEAAAWAKADRASGMLLRSPRLEEAERWIASRPRTAPAPTDDTKAFILESRSGANRRRRVLTGGLAIGLVLAIALALSALWQRNVAVEQEARARDQRETALETKSRLLANRAAEANGTGDFRTAILLSLEALRGPNDEGPKEYSREAEKSLLEAIYSNPLRAILRAKGGRYVSVGFVGDTAKVVAVDDKGGVALWHLDESARVVGDAAVLDIGVDQIVAAFPNPHRPVVVFLRKDSTYLAWNVEQRRPIPFVAGICRSEQRAFAFDESGRRLFVYCPDASFGQGPPSADAGVSVVDLDTGKLVHTLGRFNLFEAAPDGSKFVVSTETSVMIYDSASGRRLAQWAQGVTRLQIDHGGKKVYVIDGYDVGVRDAATGKSIAATAFAGQARSIEVLASNRQDLLIVEGDDGHWVWRTNAKPAPVQTLSASPVRFLPDGALVTTDGKKIAIVDYRIEGHMGTTYSSERAVFYLEGGHELAGASSDSRNVLTLAKTGEVYVWSSEPAMMLGKAADQGAQLGTPIAFSADGAVIATNGTEDLTVWDARTFKPMHRFQPESTALTGLELSADGRWIAYVEDGGTYDVVDLSSGKPLESSALPKKAQAVGFAPDGRRLALAADDGLSVWSLETASRSRHCAAVEGAKPVTRIAWTGDDRIAYVTSDGAVDILAPDTCARAHAFAFPVKDPEQFTGVTVRSKGDLMMALAEYRMQGWSQARSRKIMDFSKEDWDIFDPSVAADTVFDIVKGDRFLMGRQSYRQLGLYDADKRSEIFSFEIDKSECCGPAGIRVSAKGDRLAALYHDRGAFRLSAWRLLPTVEDAIAYATTNIPECLSPAERGVLGLDATPPAWCIAMKKRPYDTEAWRAKPRQSAAGRRDLGRQTD